MKFRCFEIQGCPEEERFQCPTWNLGVNCWNQKNVHPCCDRKSYARCLDCPVFAGANLPSASPVKINSPKRLRNQIQVKI